jgi:hypothetical protein
LVLVELEKFLMEHLPMVMLETHLYFLFLHLLAVDQVLPQTFQLELGLVAMVVQAEAAADHLLQELLELEMPEDIFNQKEIQAALVLLVHHLVVEGEVEQVQGELQDLVVEMVEQGQHLLLTDHQQLMPPAVKVGLILDIIQLPVSMLLQIVEMEDLELEMVLAVAVTVVPVLLLLLTQLHNK